MFIKIAKPVGAVNSQDKRAFAHHWLPRLAAVKERQPNEDKAPYWRTLKANGELNSKYSGGIKAQKEKLEAEGYTIIQRGRKILVIVNDINQGIE